MRLANSATAIVATSVLGASLLAGAAWGQPYRDPKWNEYLAEASAKPTPQVNGHADLSGVWTGSIPTFPVKRSADGSIQIISNGGRAPVPVAGAPAAAPAPRPPPNDPVYKPELRAKWKEMHDQVSKIDKVFYCGMPGVPRLGVPGKIIQTPTEVVLLYSVLSGDAWRVVPTDGRGFPEDAEPTFNGDAVGRWEGDTLVIEGRNFSEDTWFNANAGFHSENMKVTERLKRQGDTLVYSVIVEDPDVLEKPWSPAPTTVLLTNEKLDNALGCQDVAGPELLNFGHD